MKTLPLLLAAAALVVAAAARPQAPAAPAPASTASTPAGDLGYVAGKLRAPPDYREWIYVTTGLDMSYSRISLPGHHMFDSVFVDPAAWQAFKRTGTWPEGTAMVLETRGAQSRGSINRHGYFQDTDLMGLEVHVKDSARFGPEGGGWAFFSFEDPGRPAAMLPRTAGCYGCHAAHGAVDTTFVQFYPTLLPLARARGTLSAGYLQELAASAAD